MTAAILTPFASKAAVPAGPGRWRKMLLPKGSINYKGRRINFDEPYLQSLAQSYQARAYDQVPFQLANDKNDHTNDPERFRGEIISMDVQPDGLWVTLEPTPAGHKVLTDNPKLGVSARIVEDYDRADGQFYPQAIQHVLGTLDPRIPNMGGWQAIEAANSGETKIIDLTEGEWAPEPGKEGSVPENDAQARLAQLLNLPGDQFDRLTAMLAQPVAQIVPPAQPVAPAAPVAPATADDDSDLAAWIDSLSDEDLAALEAEFDAQDTGQVPAGAGAQLSNDALMAIEFANANAQQAIEHSRAIQEQLDAREFASLKRSLAEDFGIAPYITELARPFLEGPGEAIDLSNGDQTTNKALMTRILTEIGKTGSMLGGVGLELGTELDLDEESNGAASEARATLVEQYKSQMKGLL